MTKSINDQQIKSLTKVGRTAIEDNLYIEVERKKNVIYKRWRLIFTENGKRQIVGLGSYPKVSLKDAREEKRRLMVEYTKTGISPAAILAPTKRVRTRKVGNAEALEKTSSFMDVADAYIKNVKIKRGAWKEGGKSEAQWRSSLASYVEPVFGKRPIGRITEGDVVEVLDEAWSEVPETAARVKMRMKTIFAWAKVQDLGVKQNPVDEDMLEAYNLAKRTKKPEKRVALHYDQLPEFWESLSGHDGTGADALRMLVLTGMRSLEVRAALWSLVDFKKRVWTARIFKNEKGAHAEPVYHDVPIGDLLMEILARRRAADPTGEYIFPKGGSRPVKSKDGETSFRDFIVTEASLRKVVKAIGFLGGSNNQLIHQHGLRTTLMDCVRDLGFETTEVVDCHLTHGLKGVKNPNVTGRYIQNSIMFNRRAEMLRKYDNYIITGPVDQVAA